MTVHLIVAELDGAVINKATKCAVAAAQKIPGTCIGLVMGKSVSGADQDFAHYVDKVVVVESENLAARLADSYAQVIGDVAKELKAAYVWAGATAAGKDCMPRVAARLEAAMASDIQEVVNESTFKRPMWAGDIVGTVELKTPIKVVTVRATEFAPAADNKKGSVEKLSMQVAPSKVQFVSLEAVKSERPSLADASVVISGGRGLKGPEGFKQLIEPLADKLNAAIGASRAVCDANWVPNDWQVGQTGKVVAPKLYIAIGISGAIQHVAGMKKSKTIVAINKDPDAPIFKVADYGLVGDAFTLVPELISKI